MASGMNPLKEKWNETPKNPKNIKSSNHLTLPNEMKKLETFKWNEIGRRGVEMGSLPIIYVQHQGN